MNHGVLQQYSRLSDARRAFTRTHIRNAAREIFFTQGYATTRVEEIAQAAGTSRSTLYTYFRDKEEILQEIADDYIAGLCGLVERLPGPAPSRPQIDTWLHEIAAFIALKRAPTILILGLAGAEEKPAALHHIGDSLIAALGTRLAAFRRVSEDGPHQALSKAWASVVLREIGCACQHYVREGEAGQGPALLTVAGDLFERFITEPR